MESFLEAHNHRPQSFYDQMIQRQKDQQRLNYEKELMVRFFYLSSQICYKLSWFEGTGTGEKRGGGSSSLSSKGNEAQRGRVQVKISRSEN